MTSEEQAADAVRNLAIRNPPSRFAVCAVYPEDEGFGSHIVAWGIAEGGRVHVNSVEPGMTCRFQSLDSLSLYFDDLFHVVWIDPQPQGLDESV